MGFSFKNLNTDQSIHVFIDRHFDLRALDSLNLRISMNDRRAFTPIMAKAMNGAWSNDITDIEFVS